MFLQDKIKYYFTKELPIANGHSKYARKNEKLYTFRQSIYISLEQNSLINLQTFYSFSLVQLFYFKKLIDMNSFYINIFKRRFFTAINKLNKREYFRDPLTLYKSY